MSTSVTAASLGDSAPGGSGAPRADKSVADGDEESVGMSLAVTVGSPPPGGLLEPEIMDPAILAVSVEGRTTHRPYQYSRERLLELRNAPLSRQRPEYLDPQHNNQQGLWDPERWHHVWKRAETPNDNGPKSDQPDNHSNNKRRSGDPRERIRKEQDGIVLSPQRRSFNSGCFVPVTQQPASRAGRPDSPLGSKGDQHLSGGHREISQGARRIGSGRIIARDVSWDYRPDKGDLDGPEYAFGRPGQGGGPGRERKDTTERERDDRFERRPYGRDFERDREKDRHISRNGRYSDRRRISSDSKDDEPEWFSGGPTSQHDTIELRGFEDLCEERSTTSTSSRKKQSPSNKKRSKERSILRSSNESVGSTKEESPKGPGARSTPTPSDGPPSQAAPHSPIAEEKLEGDSGKSDGPSDMSTSSVQLQDNSGPKLPAPLDFNLEDFLKMDSIPGLLTNSVENDMGSSVTGSRFSRWFNKETSPVLRRETDSRRSSIQDENIVNNIINGIGDSDTYFAPISPAAATTSAGGAGPPAGAKPVTLLELLQRGNQSQPIAKQPSQGDVPPALKNMGIPGKVLRIDELEARIMQGPERSQDGPIGGPPGPNHTRSSKPDEDLSAFKQLLAQVSGGQAVAASNGPLPHKGQGPNMHQPLSILQMLNKSQQDDARAAAAHQHQHHGLLGPPSPGGAGPHIPKDLVLQLHQVQQHQQRQQQQQAEMFSKLMNSNSNSNTTHRQQQQFPLAPHSNNDLAQNLGVSGRELLQRPEAVAILQGLKRGDITPQHLIQQLAQNPAMQPRHRELLMTILKQSNQNVNLGPSPRVLSPIPPPQQHLLYQQQQQQQQQLRVSPLPPAAFCVSPILATSPNTLSVHHPGMQQRIPSPRELQAHTQGIMQRALIKKKLEEQQENFRKKQEMQQRSQSPLVPSSATPGGVNNSGAVQSIVGGGSRASPAKHMSSPTPLAFTPTSVLRKMTADKDFEMTQKDMNNKNASNENLKPSQGGMPPPGRPVTGMRQPVPTQQPLQPQNWNLPPNQVKQPVGRAIVKGSNNFQQQFMTPAQEFQQFQMQQQQQHQRNLFQQQRIVKMPQQPYNMQNRPGGPGLLPQQMGMSMQQVPQQHNRHKFAQPVIPGRIYDDRGMPLGRRTVQLGRGSPNDGDLSPTSDQLARWFSPELLARAREGKLPALPDVPAGNISQSAINLEEIERLHQNTAPVHN